ncbi:threonine aldolase family protein [Rhodococcus sp. JS3073]|uniref:threonine aldolase family protein n=1 Tax=Rhodococcus sp. JS3073 TaxID=3002901 RepID=UPI002285442A|nr:GntG family PLP-dependent aldolase [Rhodococcus sp. JS3073]WAM19214.1 aminotransferase class I/II-fold pyridoxal phosphate-dependent enzyme [Rhodococcus sp. JS3073]
MNFEIDLRSDTVTKPCADMRRSMAEVEVGDDVLDHDPTMAELECRVADMLGMPAALWVPSGTMGNIIALMLHLDRGDRFLAPEHAHVLDSELGTAAWLAQGMPEALPHDAGPGRPTPGTIKRATVSAGPYFSLRTTLLCLENSHNFSGGSVIPPQEWTDLVVVAKELGLHVHLDGARLWNACVALSSAATTLTQGADTVQVCLSKGLGAPVGSILAADATRISEARRFRKMLGGGVRQGGVLAAAGLVALRSIDRLADDHENAQRLSDGLRERGWNAHRPDTNIVLVEVADPIRMVKRLSAEGIGATSVVGKVRFVTHRDVDSHSIDNVLDRVYRLSDLADLV